MYVASSRRRSERPKTTNSEQQVTAREEFARPSKKRQQQRMTSWTTEQSERLGNGQKQELPVIFWPKMGVRVNNSGREYCWPYLVGQHPFSTVFGQRDRVLPVIATLLSFHPFLAIICSVFGYFMFLSGRLLELTRTDRENNKKSDVNIDKTLL